MYYRFFMKGCTDKNCRAMSLGQILASASLEGLDTAIRRGERARDSCNE
jgi:hypothetical protein